MSVSQSGLVDKFGPALVPCTGGSAGGGPGRMLSQATEQDDATGAYRDEDEGERSKAPREKKPPANDSDTSAAPAGLAG